MEILSSDLFYREVTDYKNYWCQIERGSTVKCGICTFMISNEDNKIRQKLRRVCKYTSKFPVTTVSVFVVWYLFKTELEISTNFAIKNIEPYSVFKHLIMYMCPDKKIDGEIDDLFFFHKHDYVKKCGINAEESDEEDEGLAGSDLNLGDFEDAKSCKHSSEYEDWMGEEGGRAACKRKRGCEEDEPQPKKKKTKKVSEGEIRYASCVDRLNQWFKGMKTGQKCKLDYDVNNSLKISCLHANCGKLGTAIAGKKLPCDTRELISRKHLEKLGLSYDQYVNDDTLYGTGQIGVKRACLGGTDLTSIPILLDDEEDEEEEVEQSQDSGDMSFNTMFAIEESTVETYSQEEEEENEFQRKNVIDDLQFKLHTQLKKMSATLYKLHKDSKKLVDIGEFAKIAMITGEPCLSCSFLVLYQFRASLAALINMSRAHMLKVRVNNPGHPSDRIYEIPLKRQRDPDSGKFVQSTEKPFFYEKSYKPTLRQRVDCISTGVSMLGEKAVKIIGYREESCETGEIDEDDYTYDFMGEEISETCFDIAYRDWKDAFPFFPDFTEVEKEEIFSHMMPLSSPKIWCYTNPRVASIETDIHTSVTTSCPLPLKVRLAELLCKVNKKPITVLKNGLVDVTRHHGMKYTLNMVRTIL